MKQLIISEVARGSEVLVPNYGIGEVQNIDYCRLEVDVYFPQLRKQVNGISIQCLELSCFAFPIGAKVKSLLGGGFEGTVTGHEPQNNRVMCCPIGKEPINDRSRWAYKPGELEIAAPEVFLKINDKYRVTDKSSCASFIVRVVGHPEMNMVNIIRDDSAALLGQCACKMEVTKLSKQFRWSKMEKVNKTNY